MGPLVAVMAVVLSNVPVAYAAPSVTITLPVNNATVLGTQSVQAQASSGTLGVRFKLDGVNIGPEDLFAPYSYNWNTTTTTNGPHALTAHARRVGSTITSAPVTVNVQNPPIPGTVSVLGDSVSQQAFQPNGDGVNVYTANAPAPDKRDIFVYMGWAVPNVQPHATDMAKIRWPEKLIAAVGLNDATTLWGSDGWTVDDVSRFRTLINTPHVNSCVAIVLPGYGVGANPAWAAQIDEARVDLAALATERPHTITVDWQPVINQHPEYIDEDGIHLLTPYTTWIEDLIAAGEGRLSPVDPVASAARQEFYWSAAAQCTL